MTELIVGIDLGTTNSAIAVVDESGFRVLPVHGSKTMPSVVGLDASGNLIVGQAAKNQMVASPESTVASIKRSMGESMKVSLGGKEFSPEEISSFILAELKRAAEKELGRPVTKAVITVPAFFNDRQRRATQTAGELAGLDVVRIINEPTAAALAYGAGRTADETMLVYDLGGGTFDVSLVTVENDVVEVKASHGDTRLGGDDFDQLLLEHVLESFKNLNDASFEPDARLARRLKVSLERAKRTLSDEAVVQVKEEYLAGDRHLDLEIERHTYEDLIAGLLEKTMGCLHQALTDGGLRPGDVDKLMLVGGSSRTPLVSRMLEERFGLEPRFEIDPDLIVAMGAALQGSLIAGGDRRSVLVDITPHTFSTSALAPPDEGFGMLHCVPIIRRNTPLPAKKSEMFYTVSDGQKAVIVDVFQGESAHPEENVLLGDFRVEGLSPAPAGNGILISFALDLNGVLTVVATEKSSGLSKNISIDTRGAETLDLAQARKNVDAMLAGDSPIHSPDPAPDPAPAGGEIREESVAPSDADPSKLMSDAKELRKRGEALMETGIAREDADEIRTLIHQSVAAIKDRDWDELFRRNTALSDLLFYLED